MQSHGAGERKQQADELVARSQELVLDQQAMRLQAVLRRRQRPLATAIALRSLVRGSSSVLATDSIVALTWSRIARVCFLLMANIMKLNILSYSAPNVGTICQLCVVLVLFCLASFRFHLVLSRFRLFY